MPRLVSILPRPIFIGRHKDSTDDPQKTDSKEWNIGKFFANAEETVAKIRHNTDCEIHLFDLDDHDKLRAEIDSSVILTNATGVGMKPFEGQMLLPDDSFLRPDLIVSDVVYNPRKTHLLEVAEKKGCRTLNGLGMMLWQGARAFEIWTGKQMPVDYIKSILF